MDDNFDLPTTLPIIAAEIKERDFVLHKTPTQADVILDSVYLQLNIEANTEEQKYQRIMIW